MDINDARIYIGNAMPAGWTLACTTLVVHPTQKIKQPLIKSPAGIYCLLGAYGLISIDQRYARAQDNLSADM